MLDNLFWILNEIRTKILSFEIPQLGISYWDFCIYLAVAGIAITVLVNAVNVSADRPRKEKIERERKERFKNRKANN